MRRDTARELIQKSLNSGLYHHSMRVEETAEKLAAAHNADKEKAALTGLLHDYGKSYSKQKLLQFASQFNIADETALHEPNLLHAPVGAWLLEHEIGIKDPEIVAAVRTHTTGIPKMSLLAQVVYLADYIEPERDCPGVDKIRELAFNDLTRALLHSVDLTIKYVLERQRIVHPDSINFRNSLIISLQKGRREFYGHEAI